MNTNAKNTEWKVGLFAVVAITLLALLMVNFAKGSRLFKQTYEIKLRSINVGGIKKDASVLMSGVPIGTVAQVDLSPDGKSVILTLAIQSRYKIHRDALFQIEQAGFLGDQFIAVSPQENTAPELKAGDEVECREPFDLQEAARAAVGLIKRVDDTVARLNNAVILLNHTVISTNNLTNIVASFDNFRSASDRAVSAVDDVRTLVSNASQLVTSNGPSIGRSVGNIERFTEQLHTITNMLGFSDELSKLAAELQQTVATNRADLTEAVKNVRTASESLNSVMSDIQAGKGMVGGLLKEDAWKEQTSLLLNNLTTLSSNLNRFGLLYKPKPVKTNSAPSFYPAQQRFR